MIYILVFLGIIALLLLIAAIRAVLIKKEYPEGTPFDMENQVPFYMETAEKLSKMIQVPTVSRRGSDDKTQIYAFHRTLETLFPLIHQHLEKVDIDGALLFKWKGESETELPILLMSHQDVVEASGKWKHDAFSGAIDEGKIWGRGTVDTKGALCAILESVERLLAEGFTPKCDVYIASSNNEEITGDGAIKTVEYLYNKGIKLALVMDEGGMVNSGEHDGNLSPYNAMVGIFEKGRANVKFIAKSTGGHASVPFNGTPFARLSKLMYLIEYKNPFKKRLTAPVRLQYEKTAPYMRYFKHRFFYGNLWLFGFIAPYIMHKKGGAAGAMVKTTCVFTMAQGSMGANVIPENASVVANMRFMIHEPLKPSYEKIARIAHKLNIDVEMITGFDVPPVADMNSYAYQYLIEQIGEEFGDIPKVPYIMLAGTDARHYTKICDCVIRFVPLMVTSRQINSPHAINENLNIESLARGVKFYMNFIRNYGKSPQN